MDGSATGQTWLASASSAYYGQFLNPVTSPGYYDVGDVMIKILGGNAADPSPNIDGYVNWNFEGIDWFTGVTYNPGEIDMVSTAIHEIVHTLGFSSSILESGIDDYGTPLGTPSIWQPFYQFVGDSNGALINSSFELDLARWNDASIGGTGAAGLYFLGANAVAANGGNPVFLFSPTTWNDGSSGSHLDSDFYDGTNGNEFNMMNHEASVYDGLDIRQFNNIEIGMLIDIGYTNLIPEPSPLLLGIAGTGFLALLRRRRSHLPVL